ncbi:Crp/Fnr family transcriptional regulator [Chishuiella changwenlii]|jgi:CRP-like cAMP-binding protein|uniref:Crp/Fnr family transcriptional regulator n=1 Tax=Chishuiella changwenlii TaxID=1434701 RepID=UPI002FD87EA6
MEELKNHIQNFINIERERLEILEHYFEKKVYKKKETILSEGQICDEKFFVAKGCLQIFFLKQNGIDQTIDFAIENWWATDFSAFGNNAQSQYSIRTTEKAELFAITYSNQLKLLELIPELEQYFHRIFQIAYAASQNRIKYLYEFSREDLYRTFVKNYPEFVQRVPQYLLASFLGFTPEYLSELRKKFIS